MNESIDETKESAVTTWSKFDSKPYTHRHNTMMDHMQSGDMTVLLSQNKEECIKEFSKFGKVIPPASMDHP